MTKTTLLIPLAASLMLGTAAFAQSNMDPRQSTHGGMAIDQETSVNGIPAACTGVGGGLRRRKPPIAVLTSIPPTYGALCLSTVPGARSPRCG